MKKYSKQLVDSVFEEIKNVKKPYVSGEIETAIMDTLVPDRKTWPKDWNSSAFTPCHNMADALSLLNKSFPNENWSLKKKEQDIFESFVRDETTSVFAHTPERALVLAIWNLHNFEEEEK